MKDGVAVEVKWWDADGIHPANGKVCVKAYGLIQKAYNPNRIRTPMKRTNPRKGAMKTRIRAHFLDQALEEITEKLLAVRAQGLKDEAGLPRLAVSFGHGGTPSSYMGTLPAFLAAWGGPIDFSFGSGQGVGCTPPSTSTASTGTAALPFVPIRSIPTTYCLLAPIWMLPAAPVPPGVTPRPGRGAPNGFRWNPICR